MLLWPIVAGQIGTGATGTARLRPSTATEMPRCSNCGATVPEGQLTRQRVLKGHNGRRKNGYLLMCNSCASTTQESNQVVIGIALAVMAVLALLVFLVRGH